MFGYSDVTVTMDGVLSVLYALVAVLILVVLYHMLFIVVDLRKIMRRFEETTAQVEAMILKPLAILDEAFQWVMTHMHGSKKKGSKKHKNNDSIEVSKV